MIVPIAFNFISFFQFNLAIPDNQRIKTYAKQLLAKELPRAGHPLNIEVTLETAEVRERISLKYVNMQIADFLSLIIFLIRSII